ncbi:HTH domain-containing protein [Staphylococcus equorum]|uniref:HTH domain-containing protein n=1 Tax=Staphylococcus equorum TaxID=246432 RepID=A0A9X4L9B9_9STAP|nr:HTH domain-containing protein [Staphylococcus equorum]MDG0842257.1 HTH domain-containing protein [Staphylococcus equorum]MDG0858609.1 HTH domain-containing protein [Staphylococcus equorum]
MEKPERLLYIYTRFLNGKKLNKEELAQRLNVNVRSIQRDFSDINNFLYEDNEWHGLDGEIIYDNNFEKHCLRIDRYKFKNNRLLNLLFRLKNFTPIIHEDTYNLIRGLNANSNLAEKILSNKLLSQFKITREMSKTTLIFRLQLAIENNNFVAIHISHNLTIKVIPIYTRYFSNKYWFTYLYQGKVYILKLSSIINIDQLDEVFDKAIFSNIQCVTMHIKDPIWPEIQRQFIIIDTTESNLGTNANIIISKKESIQIAYEYPQYITIMEPQHYVDEFKAHIQTLFKNYNI